jgi:hypothetical protein
MINKKVSTVAGSLIITAIVIAIGFVFLSSKEEVQIQNNVVSDNSDLGNREVVKQEDVQKENETESEQEEEINTSDWKNYSNEKISLSYPNNYELKTGSDSLSEKEPNTYSFDNISGKKNEWLFFLYNNLSEKYKEDMINSPNTVKYKESQISTGEKIIILKFKNDKFLSYISKKDSATSLEVYGPLITAPSKEIMTYEEFIKSIRIK